MIRRQFLLASIGLPVTLLVPSERPEQAAIIDGKEFSDSLEIRFVSHRVITLEFVHPIRGFDAVPHDTSRMYSVRLEYEGREYIRPFQCRLIERSYLKLTNGKMRIRLRLATTEESDE